VQKKKEQTNNWANETMNLRLPTGNFPISRVKPGDIPSQATCFDMEDLINDRIPWLEFFTGEIIEQNDEMGNSDLIQ